jgi:hypothetical protein
MDVLLIAKRKTKAKAKTKNNESKRKRAAPTSSQSSSSPSAKDPLQTKLVCMETSKRSKTSTSIDNNMSPKKKNVSKSGSKSIPSSSPSPMTRKDNTHTNKGNFSSSNNSNGINDSSLIYRSANTSNEPIPLADHSQTTLTKYILSKATLTPPHQYATATTLSLSTSSRTSNSVTTNGSMSMSMGVENDNEIVGTDDILPKPLSQLSQPHGGSQSPQASDQYEVSQLSSSTKTAPLAKRLVNNSFFDWDIR